MDQHKQDQEQRRGAQAPPPGAGTERNEEEVGRPVELDDEQGGVKKKQGGQLPRDPGAGETVPAK